MSIGSALTVPKVPDDGQTNLPPVVPGSILLGSARELRRDMLGACERAFREYGDVVRFSVGPPGLRQELCLMFHPDAARDVLAAASNGYRKENSVYGEIRGSFGDGLLTSQDDEWLRQKRFLQPLFTARRVAGYAATMGAEVADLARRWRQRPAQVVDLHEEMSRLTLAVVGRILFGEDVREAGPVLRRSFEPLADAVMRRAMAPVRLPRHWPTPLNRRMTDAQRALFAACDEIIARRERASSADEDMIGLLLQARDAAASLDHAEVRDQVLVFLLAGHETTSIGLTYALHLLGRHPYVQRRVREEVDAVIGDRMPTASDVADLPYTTMALKEALRLYPPAPLIGRRAARDDRICGYDIPAGMDVVLAPWVVHRHPQFWDDAERFDPGRFAPVHEKARHRYAWFPFGGGPRACIGQHFAMMESVIALAALVRDFEFSAPLDEPPYTSHITLRPTKGVPSRITPRSGSTRVGGRSDADRPQDGSA